jgi:hypothetical protein
LVAHITSFASVYSYDRWYAQKIVAVDIRAKKEGTSCHQKVIALTAHALRGEKERFLSEGFDGYLSKPMGQKEFSTRPTSSSQTSGWRSWMDCQW